jgi:hypothetical protein
MSYEIVDSTGGTLTIRISGMLTYAEYDAGQRKAAEIMRQQGRMRSLVLLEQFLGLEKEGNWGDISFAMEFDKYLEKIAFVGEKKFEDYVFLFTGKGVRKVPIEFFEPADLAKARAWLAAGNVSA